MNRQPEHCGWPPCAKGETLRFAGKTVSGRRTPGKDRHGLGSHGSKAKLTARPRGEQQNAVGRTRDRDAGPTVGAAPIRMCHASSCTSTVC